ncbi:hypothetical protein [Rhodoblastus sp.]|uniref:hypothetical protein n=1 Tax=Rhodoblastus sp. TaxID=1962975 RepID=UPI003F9537F6
MQREIKLDLPAGLHVLHYVSGGAPALLRPARGSEKALALVAAPDRPPGRLAGPGDAQIVRADKPGRMIVVLRAESPDQSLDAVFRLDPLRPADSPAPAPAFALLVHIARIGDRRVAPGQWAAGPEAPAPIEGLALEDWRIPNLGVELQVCLSTRPPQWLKPTTPGKFAGTRGKSLPLCGLSLRLTGAAAEKWVLTGEALFLGASIGRRRGRDVQFLPRAPLDPLVGLRLDLMKA